MNGYLATVRTAARVFALSARVHIGIVRDRLNQ